MYIAFIKTFKLVPWLILCNDYMYLLGEVQGAQNKAKKAKFAGNLIFGIFSRDGLVRVVKYFFSGRFFCCPS